MTECTKRFKHARTAVAQDRRITEETVPHSQAATHPQQPAPLRAALIGSGIAASRTPAMHMAEGRAQGLDYRYDLIDIAARDGG